MSTVANDTIEFRLTGYCYGPDKFPTPAVEIIVNGENFRSKVRAVERPFAKAEGNPGIAGHAPITPRELYESLHDDYLNFDSVSILGCGCGVIDCWPLDVKVDVGTKTVAWYGFNMYHREDWDYSDLGKYIFDKQQYFQEVDKLLTLEKHGQEICTNFQVGFDVQKHGWIKMYMCLNGKKCITNLSYLFSPFKDILNMLKNVEIGVLFEQIVINGEGEKTNIEIYMKDTVDMFSITVTQDNSDDISNNHYCCNVAVANFIQAFKWAFQILENEGFDPNFWDEHEPGYKYDWEYETNPRWVFRSFWEDPWFQFLHEP